MRRYSSDQLALAFAEDYLSAPPKESCSDLDEACSVLQQYSIGSGWQLLAVVGAELEERQHLSRSRRHPVKPARVTQSKRPPKDNLNSASGRGSGPPETPTANPVLEVSCKDVLDSPLRPGPLSAKRKKKNVIVRSQA